MAAIVIDHVSKTYGSAGGKGSHAAVNDVSIAVADGSFTVLVGPSGCGKTTTLRMVAGLEDITSGTISIGGRVVNDVHPKDRDIAMVFQNYALYPHMNVYKNMAFALTLRKLPKTQIDQRVRNAAAILGLSEVLDRKPGALSGGQRQRVALGRAIVREPAAFLFDEPLSNLDAKLRISTRAELKALHQRLKTTTIYVTHDQEEAMTLGDTVVVMSQGRVQQVGGPLEIYRAPTNRFVATFLGTPPMNMLEGRLESAGSGVRFVEAASQGVQGWSAELPAALAARVRSTKNAASAGVALGLRPTLFSLAATGAATAMPVRVDVVEPLGDHLDLACASPGGSPLVARVAASGDVRPGSTITLGVDLARAHVFEPGEFGKNLTA